MQGIGGHQVYTVHLAELISGGRGEKAVVTVDDSVSAKRGRPQTPSAEDINDLAKDDYIFDATSCGLKGG